MENPINDLRSAIALLQRHEGSILKPIIRSIPTRSWRGFTAISARAAR